MIFVLLVLKIKANSQIAIDDKAHVCFGNVCAVNVQVPVVQIGIAQADVVLLAVPKLPVDVESSGNQLLVSDNALSLCSPNHNQTSKLFLSS